MYREQAYVERCFCEAPATGPCASCGRARCARHVTRGLCNRCTQFIGRELDERSGGRWIGSSVAGGAWFLCMAAVELPLGMLAAVPVAFAAYLGLRALQRRRLVARMGRLLSASKGELPPLPRDPDLPFNTGRGGLPPGAGPAF